MNTRAAGENLVQMFRRQAQTFGSAPMLLSKRAGAWQCMSWNEVREQVDALASGLIALGIRPGDRVALLSENFPEWVICDLAVLTCGAVTVGIYASLPAAQIGICLSDSEARAIIVSSMPQLGRAMEAKAALGEPQHVILMDWEARSADASVLSMQQVMARGRNCDPAEREARVAGIRPNEVGALVYTSGESGEPKGVMLTHRNFISACEDCKQALPPLGPEDRNLVLLPLSHIYARTCDYYLMIYCGGTITFAEPGEDVGASVRDIAPTFVNAVPRIYEQGRAGILCMIERQGALRRRIYRWSLRVAHLAGAAQRAGRRVGLWLRVKRGLADRLVLKRLRARAGGKLRFLVCGGTVLAPEVVEFFCDVGLPLLQGYGLTETSPTISVNPPERIKPGTVGRPMPGVQVRIGQYGEILVRGPNVTKGYWNKPGATAEAIKEGWLHTGDLGYLDDEGYLVLTGRKSDLILTAGGRNVAPQMVERLLRRDALIADAVVHADKRGDLCALIVPAFEELEAVARSRGITFTTRTDLVAHPAVQHLYETHLDGALSDLAPFEQVRRFAILDHDFAHQAGRLVPGSEPSRQEIFQRYAALLDAHLAPR